MLLDQAPFYSSGLGHSANGVVPLLGSETTGIIKHGKLSANYYSKAGTKSSREGRRQLPTVQVAALPIVQVATLYSSSTVAKGYVASLQLTIHRHLPELQTTNTLWKQAHMQ